MRREERSIIYVFSHAGFESHGLSQTLKMSNLHLVSILDLRADKALSISM